MVPAFFLGWAPSTHSHLHVGVGMGVGMGALPI